jgi:uncharacterized membrane protein
MANARNLHSHLPPEQRKQLADLIHQARIARDVPAELEQSKGLGDWLADRVAVFGGSWTFIMIFAAVMLAWCLLNTFILMGAAFDPYPYVFLNLMLSSLAALQAPIIMMSQNRQAAKDRAVQQNDFEVNLKAELEIMALHEKMDLLRTAHMEVLLKNQEEQLHILRNFTPARVRTATDKGTG